MSYLDDAILIAVLGVHKRFSIEKDKTLVHHSKRQKTVT